MTILYTVEGNIGSGKSTLVKLLQKLLPETNKDVKFIFLQEPVDEWKNIKDVDGQNIIEKFYTDQNKYAFSFQMMAYISRLAQLRKTIEDNPNAVIITERSVFTDRNVFAKMLYDTGKMEEINYVIYNKWFDEFIKKTPLSGIIYLKTNPTKCLERIKKRNRLGEDIPLDYLINCKKYHDVWITNTQNIDTLILDGNDDFLDEQKLLQDMIVNIKNFMEKKLPKDTGEFDMSVYIC